ncbi:2OG-Fe dioxygenase family protein [Litoribacillus peritrichatus]|uniref:2OG-Fe dioxygenase family protein n=1 Tax=Litoribacillus peritrichatus TaxID=718191 RepID=A0ABP7N908_9GAMM
MNSVLKQTDPKLSVDGDYLKQGFCVIDMPTLSDEELDSFNHMPRDGHSLSRLRKIRLTQYFGFWDEIEWVFATLPQRKYVQSADYIKLSEAGGVPRHREQLTVDPSSLVSTVLESLPVDRERMYQINVNQIRVIANSEFKGITVPEGPHRDGHEYSIIAIAKRHNVTGGETQVIDPNTNEVLYKTTLSENQAILIDDERFIHYATPIEADKGDIGYRDIWVIEISPWENRAYGPAHERKALGSKR